MTYKLITKMKSTTLDLIFIVRIVIDIQMFLFD